MAATSLDLTSFQEALKHKYSPDKLMLMGYDRNPWFGICPKRTDLGGRNLLQPMYHSGGRGKGASTIQQAIDNQSQADLKQFVITRAKLYSVASVDRETLKASVGEPHAWLEAETALMDERVYELTQDIAMDMYGSGSGARGTLDATTPVTLNNPAAGTDRLHLANKSDIVNFEVGMFIGAADTEIGAVKDDDYFQVTAIDRTNGYVFVLGNTETDTAWDAGDFLFERGDAHDATSYKKLRGLKAWVPSVAPVLGDSFFGVDRSVESTRLAGLRYDGTSQAVHEAVIDAGTLAFREGSRPKIVLINPVQAAEVAKSLQGQAEYDVVRSSDGVVGYDALRIRTGAGTVRLVPDANCPVASAFMLDPEACVLWTLGETLEMVDEDGQVLLRAAAADTFEVRYAMYGQFVVRKPKEICHITLAV